jgi:hypothetical protein
MRASLCFLLASLFLAACGGNVVVDSAAGTGGVTGTGGSTGTGVTTSTSTSSCLSSPQSIPKAFKACITTGDCTQQDIPTCCTTFVVGVAASRVADFKAYEAACVMEPGCGCVAPPVAENGQGGNIQVACQSGQCMTFGQ